MNTFAMDMALKRQQYFIQLVNKLSELVLYASVMVNHDERDRIVNKQGQIIGRYK